MFTHSVMSASGDSPVPVGWYFSTSGNSNGSSSSGTGDCTTFWTVYDRNRLTPVTLTAEYPVTKLVVYSFSSDAHLFDHERRFLFSVQKIPYHSTHQS